jgi:hypothetical protein
MKPTNPTEKDHKPSPETLVAQQNLQRSPTMDDHARTKLDQLRDAVRKSNLPDLEWGTILGAFHEEGIGSLEDLAKRLVRTFRDPLSAPQAINLGAIMRRTPERDLEAIVHKVPKYPVLRDGVVYDPSDIVRFNGQVLLYIVDGTFRGKILVVEDHDTIRTLLVTYLFGGIAARAADIAAVVESKAVPPSVPPLRPQGVPESGLGSEQPGTEPPSFDQYPYRNPSPGIPSSPDLRLFSDHGFGGSRLDVRAGTQWSDLTKAYIFYPFDDWNDEISSMQPTSSSAIFKEHVDFKGSYLIAPKDYYVYNFEDYGWNDRISSVLNVG